MFKHIQKLNQMRRRVMVLAGASFMIVVLQPGCTQSPSDQNNGLLTAWQPKTPMPEANAGFMAGTADDLILILGGTNWTQDRKHWLDTIHRYSTDSNRWISAGTLPGPMAYAACGSDGRGLYWLGGSDGKQTSASLYRANASGSVRHIADTGHPVVYAGAAFHDGWLYVVAGGKQADDLRTLTDRCVRVSVTDGRVQALPPYPGGAVMLPAVESTGGELLVFGGATYNASTSGVMNTGDAYAYSFENRRWRSLATLPHARRGMASCVLPDQTVLLAGGYGDIADSNEEGFAKDSYRYHGRSDRYTTDRELPLAAMGQALVCHNNRLYLAGGEDKPRHRTDLFFMMPIQGERTLRENQSASPRETRR